MRIRRLWGICLMVAVAAALPGLAQQTGVQQQTAERGGAQTLPAPLARELGLEAIRLGQPALAADIAKALLASDAEDPFGHYLLATALLRVQQLPEAQMAGKLAFRHAQTPEQRYQSARLVALAAYDQQRLGVAQWWLRRAAQHAPEAARRARSEAEFNAVRRKNPVNLALRFAVVPSDNVNNGSSGAFNVIDGVPFVGTLSPDAQKLGGTLIEAGADLSYRLRTSPTDDTSLGVSLSLRDVQLSRAAVATLAGFPEPDLDQQRLEISLTQRFFPVDQRQRLSFVATVGQLWQGDVAAQPYLRLQIGFARVADAATVLDIAASAEQRGAVGTLSRGDRVFTLRGGVAHQMGKAGFLAGGQVAGTVYASAYDTVLNGRSATTVGAQLSFAPGRDFGPVRASVSLGVQTSRFPGYSLASLTVPGGRQDTTGFAELHLLFPRVEYAGFAPQLTLRHEATSSNVSRFDTRESSVTLGIRSTF